MSGKMKVAAIAAVVLIAAGAAVLLFAPKEMPLEGVSLAGKTPGTVTDGVVSGDPISAEAGAPAQLSAILPGVEEVRVSGLSATGGAAEWDGEKGVVTVTYQEAGLQEISLTFSAPGFRDAVCSWPVEVELPAISLEATTDQGEPLAQGTELLLAEGDGPSALTVSADVPSAVLTLDTTGCIGVAEATLEGEALTLVPVAAGRGEITITAQADGYREAAFTLTVEVVPVIEISADKASLTLAAGESGQVRLSSQAPDAVFEVRTEGDAAASVDGDLVTVTGGKSDAKVVVTASASGYASGELVIPVTVRAAAPQQTQNPTAMGQDSQSGGSGGSGDAAPSAPSGGQLTVPAEDTSAWDGVISEIIRLTNEERAAAGLSALKHIKMVDTPATIRAREADEYWSHTRPDGRDFSTVFADTGLSYSGMGENLFSANTVLSAQEVVDAWMGSPDHRRNILDERFTGIGVGVWQGDEYTTWCQLFVA